MDLDLDAHLTAAGAAVADAANLDALAAVDAELLGKRSVLATVRSQLGGMEPDQRKVVGRRVEIITPSVSVLECEIRRG